MLTLRDIGTRDSCLQNIGMDFIESWYLKILVVEKLLLQSGDISDVRHFTLGDIHEDGEDTKRIYIKGVVKPGMFKRESKLEKWVSRASFDEMLDSTFPLIGSDKSRFNAIRAKKAKHM